ncbi:MAG: DUF2147 domain-containing protein [Methylobacterium mesophilicum]|nr:DUF2147 domain-containing protein [Methylobacterium mesophilicum]
MTRILALATGLLLSTALAHADPIEGNWRTKSGATAAIANCGGSFCITLKSGKHAGKKIGTFSASGDSAYAGEITDPNNDKTYSGKASLSGDNLKLGGCILGGLICRNENWSRL